MMFNRPVMSRPSKKKPSNESNVKQNIKNIKQLFTPSASMVMPSIFVTKTQNLKKGLVFNPLNYQWCEYPEEVIDMMNDQSMGEIVAKDAGVIKDVYWCFNGIEVFMWRQNGRQSQKFRLPKKSQIVAFGELQTAPLHFKNQKCFLLVVGIQNYIHLYGIDKEKLEATDFKMLFSIQNSSFIQKIIFVKNTKILIASNTGKHLMLDFTEQIKLYKPQGSFIQKSLPYLPLFFSQKQRFCEQLLCSGDLIVSLVREERKKNWLTYKTKQLINYLTDNSVIQEWIIEETRIQIYKINRANLTISLIHIIKQKDIFNHNKEINIVKNAQQTEQSARIIGISFQENAPNVLEIVTQSGTFTKIDLQSEYIVVNQPLTIPSQYSVGQFGFFLNKKNIFQGAKEGYTKCFASLGTNNLTLTRDSLWYISQKSIELIKTNGLNGTLLKSKGSQFVEQEWLLMIKKGYFKIKRIKPREMLIGFISVNLSLQQEFLRTRYMSVRHFQQFLDTMKKSLGQDIVIQNIIQEILHNRAEVKLNYSVMSAIKSFLVDHTNQPYRGTYYELSTNTDPNIQKQSTIQITEKVKQELWSLFFKLQNKQIKVQTEDGKELVVNAYWQALKNIFYKRVHEIFGVNPANIKINKQRINKIVNYLEKLISFIQIKNPRAQNLAAKLSFLNRQQYVTQDFFRPFRSKKNQQPPIIEQGNSEDNFDKNLLIRTFESLQPVESSLALEKQLIQAVNKIKAVIEIFLCLIESKDSEKIADLKQTLKSFDKQRILKQKLMEAISDKKKLREFHSKIPSLQIEKDLNFLDWFAEIQKVKRVDLIDLEKVAKYLSSPYFGKALKVFKGRVDLQVELLLHFRDRCYQEIQSSSKLLQQKNKIKYTVFSEDTKDILEQKIKFNTSQQAKALDSIQGLIKTCIKNYMKGQQANYLQADKMLNNLIGIINHHEDKVVRNFLEEELIKTKISEKIRMVKKVINPPSASRFQDILLNRKPRLRRNDREPTIIPKSNQQQLAEQGTDLKKLGVMSANELAARLSPRAVNRRSATLPSVNVPGVNAPVANVPEANQPAANMAQKTDDV